MKKLILLNFILVSISILSIPILASISIRSIHVQAEQRFTPMDNSSPVKLRITANDSQSGDVMWILPGVRRLDPDIFGTPDRPLGFEPPLIGVPLEGRLTNEDGTAYTTTKDPTPFSDNAAPSSGSLEMTLEDYTLVDNPNSKDKVDFRCTFTSPDGKEYEVTVNKVIPVGTDHPFFGGVATNFIHHGYTRIGPRLVPASYTYAAFWGVGVMTIDREEVANNRVVHVMVTGNMRDDEYKMALTTDEINEDEIMVHVMLIPVEVTPQGPQPSPVPTGFILPNGVEQPFLHINYHNVHMVDLIAEEMSNLQTQLESANSEISILENQVASSLSYTVAGSIAVIAAIVFGVIGFLAGRRT